MDGGNHCILLLDNEGNIRNSIRRLLRKETCRLLHASEAQEGLKILETEDVHLIIAEQKLPGMSGRQELLLG